MGCPVSILEVTMPAAELREWAEFYAFEHELEERAMREARSKARR